MSSRSLGELLLRPSAFTRTPLCQSCTTRQIPTSWTLRRHMSDTPNPGAAQPQPREPPSEHASQPSASPRPQKTSAEQTSQAIDNLFSRPARRQRPQSTSADDFRASQATDDIFGSAFSNGSSPRRSRAPPRLAFDDMLPSGSGGSAIPTVSGKPSEAAALAAQQEETFTNFPRLNPSYGRSVLLDPSRGRDIVRGINMLGSLVARNNVRRDLNKQRYHERPGLKRKRLASERWRARFKKGFTHVTARVSELTRKGW